MSVRQSLVIACGKDSACPDTKLEVPADTAVDPGEAITFRIWGPSPQRVAGYRLVAGLANLGKGTPNVYSGQTHCKYFDWQGDNSSQQFDWPLTGITRVLAYGPLFSVDAAGVVTTLATAGEDITARGLFVLRGASCLVPADPLKLLYGTVHVVASRAAYCREWAWTAPSNPTGAQWFWLYEGATLAHKFSLTMSEQPDDASIALVDFKVKVIDRRTAGAVLGATVEINGVSVGSTDQTYGMVKVFRHLSGTYPVKVAKAGYTDSDADDYDDNDAITISPDGDKVRIKIGGYSS